MPKFQIREAAVLLPLDAEQNAMDDLRHPKTSVDQPYQSITMVGVFPAFAQKLIAKGVYSLERIKPLIHLLPSSSRKPISVSLARIAVRDFWETRLQSQQPTHLGFRA